MSRSLRLALIADTFPPLRTSGAVQLRDLSREFVRQGHKLTVILPASNTDESWQLQEIDGLEVLRLKAPRTKDIDYVRRTVGEFVMPWAMRHHLKKSPLAETTWDAVIWYSPSIFFGPLVSWLKKASDCKSYLIIRDIFPEWAVDMGLMGKGPPYWFFNAIAKYQHSVADIIGVQTQGNLPYFEKWQQQPNRKLEVLQNWLAEPATKQCTIRVNETPLAGRKIFVYAGNMGVAQGMDILLDLAEKLLPRPDVGFLFVGRGSEAERLRDSTRARDLSNVMFFDEIDPDEIPDLYAQCSFGIVALDPRHKSHNIPGKFLTYMQSGLPVLANVNRGNDLAEMIREERVGVVCETNELNELTGLAEEVLSKLELEPELPNRCRSLFQRCFSSVQAVEQIAACFNRS
jgi:glycosyltransferase involved in cell wall biosynthesis